jgi:hypothetical protein
VPLASDLPPQIRTKIARMQNALVMPPSWQSVISPTSPAPIPSSGTA